ncbi:MAG: VWA domain-containing protein [Bacillota bacterium]
MPHNCPYPFTAIVGQEKAKKALLLNVINPRIGGLLISGEKGTAKSTMVRALSGLLPGLEVVDLPLNITEDRLIGAIDLEEAVLNGRKVCEAGLLARAHGQILYVDEVNLLGDYIVSSLLDVAQSGVCVVQREGICHTYPAVFTLVGTMNPEEGLLRPHFIDRFGLFVKVWGEKDRENRKEIMVRRLAYEMDREGFRQKYAPAESLLGRELAAARQALTGLLPGADLLRLAAELAAKSCCQGHRAEQILVETARALAALHGKDMVSLEDLWEAAELVLPHRASLSRPPQQLKPWQQEQQKDESPAAGEEQRRAEKNAQADTGTEAGPAAENYHSLSGGIRDKSANANRENRQGESGGGGREKVEVPGTPFPVSLIYPAPAPQQPREGRGKRSRTRTTSRQGRYVRYRIPARKIRDVAVDATLRAAALWQRTRREGGGEGRIIVLNSDLREKIRERRVGHTLLFVVDASGSMGARRRMVETKAAVLSLLYDSYQKRDNVGLVAFRGREAVSLLEITRSVELAQKKLRELPTGGRTPLAAGLELAYTKLKGRQAKDPEMIPLLVLISDGRANVSLQGGNPLAEAKELGRRIRAAGFSTLVIDTEQDVLELGLARELAGEMGARYIRLQDLRSGEITEAVRRTLGQEGVLS